MNDKTFRVLEFHKIIEDVSKEARTILGKNRIVQMKPYKKLADVTHVQLETDEAMNVIRKLLRVPFSAVEDVTQYMKRSEIGSMLLTEEVLHVGQLLYCSRNVKQFIEQLELDVPLLKEKVEMIGPLRHLEKDIFAKIDEHGEIVDDASTALYKIRQQIRHHEATIR